MDRFEISYPPSGFHTGSAVRILDQKMRFIPSAIEPVKTFEDLISFRSFVHSSFLFVFSIKRNISVS